MKKQFSAASSFTIVVSILLVVLVSGVGAYYFFVYQPQQEAAQNPEEEEPQVQLGPLEVEVIRPQRTVGNSFTEVTVIANKQIEFGDHNRITTDYLGEEDKKFYYIVTVNNIPQAGATVTLQISDQVGNEFTETLEIEKEAVALPAGLTAITPWPDAEYILDASKLDVQVTKERRLREDYVPENVVDLNKEFGIFTLNNASLRGDAALALDSMLRDLRAETGITDVTVVSGYRSYETQVETYAYWVRSVGQKRANEILARPGHSEHQLGTTIDFSTVALNYELSEDFGQTAAGIWLAENSEEYGFRQFSDGDYDSEPWQFRWYGNTETATTTDADGNSAN